MGALFSTEASILAETGAEVADVASETSIAGKVAETEATAGETAATEGTAVSKGIFASLNAGDWIVIATTAGSFLLLIPPIERYLKDKLGLDSKNIEAIQSNLRDVSDIASSSGAKILKPEQLQLYRSTVDIIGKAVQDNQLDPDMVKKFNNAKQQFDQVNRKIKKTGGNGDRRSIIDSFYKLVNNYDNAELLLAQVIVFALFFIWFKTFNVLATSRIAQIIISLFFAIFIPTILIYNNYLL